MLNGDALVSNGKRFSGRQKLWEVFNKHPDKTKDIFEKEYEAAIKPEGGYIYYSWMKLTTPDIESPKTSFIYGIPDFQWLVGAGVYLDDIEADIALMQAKLNNEIKYEILYVSLIALAIIMLFLFLLKKFNSRLENDINLFLSFFNQAADSDELIDRNMVQFYELDKMAEHANKMLSMRRHSEEALRKKERFQEALLNDMLTFVSVLTPSGDVLFVNNTPLKVGGLKLEDLIGKKFFDAPWWTHSDEVRNMVISDIKQCASGKTLVHDVEIQTADGSLMWIEYSMHPIFDEEGNVQYLIPEGRDITERKHADTKLRKYAEMQSVLLREVNHRVKNNLTSIISMLHIEEDRAKEEGMTEYLPRLQETVGRTKGLLAVHSMLSRGGWRPLPLNQLCEEIIQQVISGSAAPQAISCNVTASDVLINSDQAHYLAIVLNELATNTIKYALPNRGTATIQMSILHQHDSILLTYRDNGPGFPEFVLKNEFPRNCIGFNLVIGLIRQSLQGEIELSNDAGAKVKISFPTMTPELEEEVYNLE